MKKIILIICFIFLFFVTSQNARSDPQTEVKHQFDINDPNVTFFYPKSDSGHVAKAPLYSVYTPLPSDPNKKQGTCHWTPNKEDVGTYHIQFKATDSKGNTATKSVTLVVKPSNKPPIVF